MRGPLGQLRLAPAAVGDVVADRHEPHDAVVVVPLGGDPLLDVERLAGQGAHRQLAVPLGVLEERRPDPVAEQLLAVGGVEIGEVQPVELVVRHGEGLLGPGVEVGHAAAVELELADELVRRLDQPNEAAGAVALGDPVRHRDEHPDEPVELPIGVERGDLVVHPLDGSVRVEAVLEADGASRSGRITVVNSAR